MKRFGKNGKFLGLAAGVMAVCMTGMTVYAAENNLVDMQNTTQEETVKS